MYPTKAPTAAMRKNLLRIVPSGDDTAKANTIIDVGTNWTKNDAIIVNAALVLRQVVCVVLVPTNNQIIIWQYSCAIIGNASIAYNRS